MRLRSAVLLSLPLGLGTPSNGPENPVRWGNFGHRVAAEAAVRHLPDGMPAFFREAGAQLAFLNPEPDRWRQSSFRAMNEAFRYDHYLDLENVPPSALSARDRWEFLEALTAAGVSEPHDRAGFLPFRILELYQRIESGFRRWRSIEDPDERRWIEERLINDAGLLGHYATDASNPHHTTIHFNGWDESRAPNPGGFATDNRFHARFESRFVSAHVDREDVFEAVGDVVVLSDVAQATWNLINDSHALVTRLYELDRDVGFEPDEPPRTEAMRFAVARLATGAGFLRDLWWTAWVSSAEAGSGAALPCSMRVPSQVANSQDSRGCRQVGISRNSGLAFSYGPRVSRP